MKSRRLTGRPSNTGSYPSMLTMHGAAQQILAANVRFGSKATISAPWRDVRYYPNSDRDSELPDGRYVPLATEVHRNKKAAPLADISSSAVCLIGNFLDNGR